MAACKVCEEDGEFFQGTPEAEARHFLARAFWALHRTRQALAAGGRFDVSEEVSDITRTLEKIAGRIIRQEVH